MTRKLITAIVLASIFILPALVKAEYIETAMTRTFYVGDYSKRNVYYYELGTVAASTTDSIRSIGITPTYQGYLAGVDVSCGSTDFDTSILVRSASAAINTIDEIYNYVGANLDFVDLLDPPIPFANNEYTAATFSPKDYQRVYIRIKNDDAATATGPIRVKLTVLSK